MIIGPLFCRFWGTLVDVKKVIDVHSCLKAHITHKYHHLVGSSSLSYADNLVGLEYLNIYTFCTMIFFFGVIYIHDCNSL